MTITPPALPATDLTLLVRTAFDDATAWASLLEDVRTPSADGFSAVIEVVDVADYQSLSADQLRALLPEGPEFLLVADEPAMTGPGHPLLVIPVPQPDHPSLDEPPRAPFRVEATSLWSVDNNLSIGNVDWEDFVDECGPDGVFREPRDG